jgi:hypothetical protein
VGVDPVAKERTRLRTAPSEGIEMRIERIQVTE